LALFLEKPDAHIEDLEVKIMDKVAPNCLGISILSCDATATEFGKM